MNAKHLFANRIRELRKRKGWSQEQFSFETGIARSYVSEIESGTQNVALSNIERICKALNISIAEFFKDFK